MKLIAILFALAAAQVNPVEEGQKLVFNLTDSTFSSSVQSAGGDPWVIYFSSSKVTGATAIAPLFARLAYDQREAKMHFATVNCAESPHACSLMRVQSYPTIYLLKEGRLYTFTGPATAAKLLKFVRGHEELPHVKLFTALPSLIERALIAFDVASHDLRMAYARSNFVVKALFSLFIGLTGGMATVVLGFVALLAMKARVKAKRQ